MAASRPQWKGYLKLSLVSCAIAIYPAVSAERISFRQINRNTGNRLRQQLVDAVTGKAVDSSDEGRGYEVGDSRNQAPAAKRRPDSSLLRQGASQLRFPATLRLHPSRPANRIVPVGRQSRRAR